MENRGCTPSTIPKDPDNMAENDREQPTNTGRDIEQTSDVKQPENLGSREDNYVPESKKQRENTVEESQEEESTTGPPDNESQESEDASSSASDIEFDLESETKPLKVGCKLSASPVPPSQTTPEQVPSEPGTNEPTGNHAVQPIDPALAAASPNTNGEAPDPPVISPPPRDPPQEPTQAREPPPASLPEGNQQPLVPSPSRDPAPSPAPTGGQSPGPSSSRDVPPVSQPGNPETRSPPPATSSAPPSPSPTGNFPEPVANLKMIFVWKDTSSQCISEGRFDEAYGVLDGRNRLDPDLKNAAFLLNYCVTLFATNRMQKYKEEKEKIIKLIKEKCRPSNKELLSVASKLAKDKQYFASLIMYEITWDMFFKETEPYTSIAFTERCMQGMKNAVSKAVEDEEVLKYFITKNFLPKMHAMRQAVIDLRFVNNRFQCVKLAWITHCVEVCDANNRSRIDLLEGTIAEMKNTLIRGVDKYQIYGTLSNNLGTLYMQMGFRDKAIECYFQASHCFNNAEDFETDEKRQKYIHDVGRAIRAALGELTEEDISSARKATV